MIVSESMNTTATDIAKGGPAAGESAKPAILSAPLSGDVVLDAIRRRWLALLVVIPLVALGLGAGVWYSFDRWPINRYVAQSTLRVFAMPPAIIGAVPDANSEFSYYRSAQAALVKSRSVLNTALEQAEVRNTRLMQLQPDPLEWLDRELKVDFRQGQELMRVSLEGEEPNDIRHVVNAIVTVYLRDIVNKERTQRLQSLEKLKNIAQRYDSALKSKRNTIRELAQTLGTGDSKVLAIKQQLAAEQLALSTRELTQLRADVRRLQLEATIRADAKGDPEVPDELIDQEIARDPQAVKLRDRIRKLETDVEDFKRNAIAGKTYPALGRMEADLKEARTALDDYLKSTRTSVAKDLSERYRREYRFGVRQSMDKLESMKQMEKLLTGELESLAASFKSLNTNSMTFDELKQEIDQSQKIIDSLTGKIELLNVEVDAPARVTPLEDVNVSAKELTKTKLKYTLMTAGGSLALLFTGLLGWEARRRRVCSVDDLTQGLGLRLVGTVPPPTKQRRKPADGTTVVQPDAALTDAIDATRTVVLHASRRDNLRTIMITSALSGEGKTSVACHLALSLARAGHRILIIDGDMRRPAVGRLLGTPNSPGLAELLRRDFEQIEQVTVATAMVGLWAMPAGEWTPPTSQHLVGQRWTEILRAAGEQFDYVIIDSSPILPVADGLLMGQQVDGVIMSVLKERSLLHPVYEAERKLSRLGVRMLGIVANGIGHAGYYTYGYSYSRRATTKVSDTKALAPSKL